MNYKFQYISNEDRQNIIQSNSSLYLIEEQNIIDGNFLIFSDTLPVEQLAELTNRISILESDSLDSSAVLLDLLIKSEVI